MGQWELLCPKGGKYKAECSHDGLDVQCHITKTLNPAHEGCIAADIAKEMNEHPQLTEKEARQIVLQHRCKGDWIGGKCVG